jgi:hypothetical protein
VSVPWQSARHGRGVLLLRGEPEHVSRWAARGLVASRVVPLPSWTAVLPAEPASRALPPYDDALTVLASRPVAHRLRAAVGLFAIDGRAVVMVQGNGWRAVQRWLVWQPGRGATRAPGLRLARPPDLLAAAGANARGVGAELHALLREPRGDALGVLDELMSLLGLPGGALLADGSRHEGEVVEPDHRAVARFDALMMEEARHRAELEEESP